MPFSSRVDLLNCWERARAQSVTDKAMTLLAAADSQSTLEELGRLPLGERDARLLALRTALFGSSLRSLTSCPHCGMALEFTLDARELMAVGSGPEQDRTRELTVGDLSLQLRPVCSSDLAAILPGVAVHAARRQLCQLCVVDARANGVPVASSDLPEEALSKIAEALAAADPGADLLIDLTCEACERPCSLAFDVVGFIWTEIDAHARRLLRDVHALAWAYGWCEADVLALSDVRRLFYLEMVS